MGVISQLIYIVNKERSYAMPGILVVEDDENLNRGITFSLKKSGYEVFSAESVKKAKRIASDNNVDVTICDVNLPDG
ncbi:two-component system, OmpR family, phosphate regulon response regulator, partial [human gut metagenome]